MISPDYSRRGFTMIELLASIGIVAVLSALLLPAVSKVRNKGEAGQCVSNLRQLHAAYMEEVADNDMTIPWSYDYVDKKTSWTESYASSLGGNWQLADGGAKLASATGCPSQRRKLKLGGNRRTYAINLPLTDTSNPVFDGRDKTLPPKLGAYAQPSRTLLFADGPIKSATSTQNGCNSADKLPDCVHDGSANAAFLDGHVESLKQEKWNEMKGSLPNKIDTTGTPLSLFWLGL